MSRSSGHGPDYDAAMAGARLQWDGLSPTMQAALGQFKTSRVACHGSVAVALHTRGLVVEPLGWTSLTPMGLLVREAGLAARAEASR